MTTQRQFTRRPGTHQLALLPTIEGATPSPTQLSLVPADGLPPQLLLDRRTRTIGRAGIAELRRILADGGAAARTAA